MHFLRQLIDKPDLKDPAKNHKNIHRHYYRYSRGDFIGPAIKITKTKAKITLRGSHEYEDLIQECVSRTIPDESLEIKSVLITGGDISDVITNLGLDWKLVKSKGKTQNYKSNYTGEIPKDTIIECINIFRDMGYFLLTFNLNPSCKVTTKMRIPQPSKKKFEEDDVNARIKFCVGYISNTEKNLENVIEESLSDFKSDIPESWKSIIILNNYRIEEIIIPKDIKNSRLLRVMAIRKGKMFRSINVDGEIIEKQYSITV